MGNSFATDRMPGASDHVALTFFYFIVEVVGGILTNILAVP
jgi:hypothetical protein